MTIYDKQYIHTPAPGLFTIAIHYRKETNDAWLTMEKYENGEIIAEIPIAKEAMAQLVYIFKCMRKQIYKDPIDDDAA
jgi:hypothetical protein